MLRFVDIQLSPLRSKDSFVFAGELYSGWFTEWGQEWGKVETPSILAKVRRLMELGKSFSLYMAFGGSNFGTTAGANGFNGLYSYLPHVTSYDYDSPITEKGKATPKFSELRSVIHRFRGIDVADNPVPE